MYDRLSEWFSNLSLLLIATLVFPFIFGGVDKATFVELVLGLSLAVISLWLSLRFARISERRR